MEKNEEAYVQYTEFDEPIYLDDKTCIRNSGELYDLMKSLESAQSWDSNQYRTYYALINHPAVNDWMSTRPQQIRELWDEYKTITPAGGINTGKYNPEYLYGASAEDFQEVAENFTAQETATWLQNNGIELTPEEMEAYPGVAALMPPPKDRPLASGIQSATPVPVTTSIVTEEAAIKTAIEAAPEGEKWPAPRSACA